MCGFSGQVAQILGSLGVAYKGLNVLENDELRQGIKIYSNWPTIPQLYVKGEFVGGCASSAKCSSRASRSRCSRKKASP
jgi:monothiol glutaredoxin